MHPRYPLILAANRDEDYDRASAPAFFWHDVPNLLGGRDLKDGGTWFGLSNHLLDTPWPKVERGKKALQALLARKQRPLPEDSFDILTDRTMPDDKSLPDTGVGLQWERILSPIFISSPTYGTRSSIVLMVDGKGHVTFIERTFNSHPNPYMTAKFEFKINSSPYG